MRPIIQINDEVREMNDVEFAEYEAGAEARKAKATELRSVEVRNTRNNLLLLSDFSQLPDSPVDKQAWALYRQSLRDITKQTGFPWEVVWPTQP